MFEVVVAGWICCSSRVVRVSGCHAEVLYIRSGFDPHTSRSFKRDFLLEFDVIERFLLLTVAQEPGAIDSTWQHNRLFAGEPKSDVDSETNNYYMCQMLIAVNSFKHIPDAQASQWTHPNMWQILMHRCEPIQTCDRFSCIDVNPSKHVTDSHASMWTHPNMWQILMHRCEPIQTCDRFSCIDVNPFEHVTDSHASMWTHPNMWQILMHRCEPIQTCDRFSCIDVNPSKHVTDFHASMWTHPNRWQILMHRCEPIQTCDRFSCIDVNPSKHVTDFHASMWTHANMGQILMHRCEPMQTCDRFSCIDVNPSKHVTDSHASMWTHPNMWQILMHRCEPMQTCDRCSCINVNPSKQVTDSHASMWTCITYAPVLSCPIQMLIHGQMHVITRVEAFWILVYVVWPRTTGDLADRGLSVCDYNYEGLRVRYTVSRSTGFKSCDLFAKWILPAPRPSVMCSHEKFVMHLSEWMTTSNDSLLLRLRQLHRVTGIPLCILEELNFQRIVSQIWKSNDTVGKYIVWYDIIIMISYHTISYHIISYHIISYHIISYHIISYHISYRIVSYRIVSYRIVSYRIISYHIAQCSTSLLSWHARTWHDVPWRIVSCPDITTLLIILLRHDICIAIACHVMPRHTIPCHATPCHARPRNATPCYATPCHEMSRHATPRQATLTTPATPRHALPHHKRLCGPCHWIQLSDRYNSWERNRLWSPLDFQ